jgi:hypothetical protein
MAPPLLPANKLQTLNAFALAVGAGPPLGAHGRRVIEALLSTALLGPASQDEYVAALAEVSERPAVPAGEVSVPVDAILDAGLGPLSDDQLIKLAFDEVVFRSVGEDLCEAFCRGKTGPFWDDAHAAVEATMVGDTGFEEVVLRMKKEIEEADRVMRAGQQEADRVTPTASPRNHRRWARPVALVASLAAAVVVGVFLGSFTSPRPKQFAFATLTASGDITRGVDDVRLHVTNAGTARAFVTVVGLSPEASPGVVFNRTGDVFLEIAPGEVATIKNLPPEFERTRTVIVVLTGVPAGEAVRVSLPRPASPLLHPERASDLAEEVRRALAELGIEAQVRTIGLPSGKN